MQFKHPCTIILSGSCSINTLNKIVNTAKNVTIFDFTKEELDLQKVIESCFKSRQRNCTVILITESVFCLPRIIRKSSNYILLYDSPNKTELRLLSNDYFGSIFDCFTNQFSEPLKIIF